MIHNQRLTSPQIYGIHGRCVCCRHTILFCPKTPTQKQKAKNAIHQMIVDCCAGQWGIVNVIDADWNGAQCTLDTGH